MINIYLSKITQISDEKLDVATNETTIIQILSRLILTNGDQELKIYVFTLWNNFLVFSVKILDF
jgi:hypothetical protein